MKSSNPPRLSNRVLKLNVGFLLSDGPGSSDSSRLDIPSPVQVSPDLTVLSMEGALRLSRTKEGILAQAKLHVSVENECSRCLDSFVQDLPIEIEELYAFPNPLGLEFSINADGILDLGPIVRAEVLISTSQRALCRDDCKGLCPECGTNLNHETCSCSAEKLDPRFAILRGLMTPDK